VVLERSEVARLLSAIDGTQHLMAALLYGNGMRLMECVRLRVQDIDFQYHQIVVCDGKGQKDRVVPLPERLEEPLQWQLRQRLAALFLLGLLLWFSPLLLRLEGAGRLFGFPLLHCSICTCSGSGPCWCPPRPDWSAVMMADAASAGPLISAPLVVGVSFAYLGLLFAIAWWADRRTAGGRSVSPIPPSMPCRWRSAARPEPSTAASAGRPG
jgi:hypothetical protein